MERLKKQKKEMSSAFETVTAPERESEHLLESLEVTEEGLERVFVAMTESEDPEAYDREVQSELQSYHRAMDNTAKSYYRLAALSDELAARHKDLTKVKRRWLLKAPANGLIDLAEKRTDHFAKGMNLYKILLILFIGSFFGVVIEVLWCLLNEGHYESRAGLVYGPFNLLYGLGAVVMTAALYRFRNNSGWISFLGGMLVGSAVEYVCSFLQELAFGSRSWDYSHMPFNLNGRICLLYAVFWGVLGIAWVKRIYPWMAVLILKLPRRGGKVIAVLSFVFLVLNGVVTVIAVLRWAWRLDGLPPMNAFWELVDVRFPNDRMERIFANMTFS